MNLTPSPLHIKGINFCCLFEHCCDFCCSRSVFGGTVGPNPQKHSNVISGSGDQPGTNSQMFYEGIKVRANPFSIPVSVSGILQQPPSPQPAQQSLAPSVPVQRKGLNIVTKTVTPPPLTTSPAPLTTSESSATSGDASLPIAPAPASPILKAQLSAPPKQRDNPKGDTKSQVCCTLFRLFFLLYHIPQILGKLFNFSRVEWEAAKQELLLWTFSWIWRSWDCASWYISIVKPTRCTIFEFTEYHSTYFGRSFRPSSGVQDRTHGVRYMSYRLVDCLPVGTRWVASRARWQAVI